MASVRFANLSCQLVVEDGSSSVTTRDEHSPVEELLIDAQRELAFYKIALLKVANIRNIEC